MHDSTKTIDASDLGDSFKSTHPCAKCGALEVVVSKIATSDHDDHHIKCHGCGHAYCVDGDDG